MNIKEVLKSKKFIIIASAVATVLLTTAVILLLVNIFSKKPIDTDVSVNSDLSSFAVVSSTDTTSAEAEPSLIISSPSSKEITVIEDHITFMGKSDPAFPLTLNGEEVKRDETGAFAIEKQLEIGKNEFKFAHKETETTYIVRYKYVIIKSFSPSTSQSYASGATFAVTANARVGSEIKATFNGKTITLNKTIQQTDEAKLKSDAFIDYSGSFSLPNDNAKDINLGKVTITAVNGSNKETKYSGNITCKKAEIPVISEVIAYSAETFDGDTADDMSRPTNNYLPKGTVDYVVGRAYNNGKEYLKLRCGRRVYVSKKNGTNTVSVTKEYAGKLPDTNKISVEDCKVSKNYTVITFNSDWKAPFFLDLLPQSYTNPSKQDYTVSSVTANYLEITFCYSNSFTGDIKLGEYNPLFSSYEVVKNDNQYKLRLNFRKKGGFYGWDAAYNSKGQLVFTFLHPAQVKAASNKYGADLSGARIMIDVGHGGADSGAIGIGNIYEKDRNLALARLLKSELESIGATVILNRSGDTTLNPDERCIKLINTKPDYCIAIHHDASTSSAPNGFGAFHSTLFSRNAAKMVYDATMEKNIYSSSAKNNRNRFAWHYYFLARTTVCPVVLTENGFITGSADYSGIISEAVNKEKAEAMASAIAKYFLSIRHDIPLDSYVGNESSNSSSSTSSSVSSSINSVSSAESSSQVESSSSVDSSSSAESSSSMESSSDISSGENSSADNNSSVDITSSDTDSSKDTTTQIN